jgi:hypothetical protein
MLAESGAECQLVSVEAAIEPMQKVEGTHEGGQRHVCEGEGGSDVWPDIPENLQKKLSGCGSSASIGERCYEDPFHLRFSHARVPKRKRYQVVLDSNSHVRLELSFDSAGPPLAISLESAPCTSSIGPCLPSDSANPSDIFWSKSSEGSAVLAASFVPKGTYLLSIQEMSTNTTSRRVKATCVRYSFRLRTSPASNSPTQSVAPMLPSSLDGAAFLLYQGFTHFAGTFSMPTAGFSQHDILFTLSRQSSITVDAVAHGLAHARASVLEMRGATYTQVLSYAF